MKNLIKLIEEVGEKITYIQTTLFSLPHKNPLCQASCHP